MTTLPVFKNYDYVPLEKETDLSAINGQNVLVLLDEQNLSISAEDLGFKLDYSVLAERINSEAKKAKFHIFTATDSSRSHRIAYFRKLGFIVHNKSTRYIPLPDGRMRYDCNIDNLFAFWTGIWVARNSYDVLVLGSGDYGLSGDLSQAIHQQCKDKVVQIMTLSLPGSTSQDLDACKNKHIKTNLEIGLDLLKPLRVSNRLSSARALDSYCTFGPISFANPNL